MEKQTFPDCPRVVSEIFMRKLNIGRTGTLDKIRNTVHKKMKKKKKKELV